jgi:hypothetical protein
MDLQVWQAYHPAFLERDLKQKGRSVEGFADGDEGVGVEGAKSKHVGRFTAHR